MWGASERCELDKLKSSLPQSRPDHGTTCNLLRQATQLSTFSNLPNTQDIHEKDCKWNFLPDKICQVHVQKVCQASPAQETSERSANKNQHLCLGWCREKVWDALYVPDYSSPSPLVCLSCGHIHKWQSSPQNARQSCEETWSDPIWYLGLRASSGCYLG